MKTLLCTSIFLLFISCQSKHNNKSAELISTVTDKIVTPPTVTENKVEFKKHVADGMFLIGNVHTYNDDLKSTEKLQIDTISTVQILELSSKMYNIEGKPDKCDKAYFVKVKFQDKDYIVFGQDVYEINNTQKFQTQTDKNVNLSIFPITNFEMGASDEIGLSGCDDFSLLMLQFGIKNHFTLMKYPMNEDIHGESAHKYATLFHDDGADEKIYKVMAIQDTLIIGIKAIYQMGGSVFNLKVSFSNPFPETRISDRVRFTDDELKKMDEIK